MLLTNEILVAFDNTAKRSLRLGLVPFNTKLFVERRRISLETSKKYYYLNWLNRIVTWVSLFLAGGMIYIGMTKPSLVSRTFVILLAFIGMLILMFICLDSCFIWHCSEGVTMINSDMKAWELTDDFDDTQTSEDKEFDKNFVRNAALLINTAYRVGCLAGLGCSVMPLLYFEDFRFALAELFQLITLPIKELIGYETLFGVYLLMWWYLTICFVVEFASLASWITIGAYFANYTLKYKLRFERIQLKWRSTVFLLQHPMNAIKIYRAIHFTFQRTMEFLGNFLVGGGILGITVACFALYFIIRRNGSTLELLFFFGVLTMVFIALTAFHFIGQNYVLSCNILDSWKYDYIGSAKHKSKRWKFESRRIKAIRPIQFYVGSVWFVDGLAFVHILDTIIDKTIFLLNAFPSN